MTSNVAILPNTRAGTLTPEMLWKMDSYWRAANYLAVGQIYLYDNPLLREPLKLSHVKPHVVGHWGTVPGQNFIWHLAVGQQRPRWRAGRCDGLLWRHADA